MPLTSGMWIEAGEAGVQLLSAAIASRAAATCGTRSINFTWRDRMHPRPPGEPMPTGRRSASSAATSSTSLADFRAVRPPVRVIVRRADRGRVGCEIRRTRSLPPVGSVAEAIHTTVVPPAGKKARPSRSSRTSSRSPAPRGCACGGPCCGATGGRRMSGRWWPGTARSAIRWRSFRLAASLRDDRARDRGRVASSIERLRWSSRPEAVTFYPTLPSRALLLPRSAHLLDPPHARQLCAHRPGGRRCSGLLSLVSPLITQVLVNSVIPRSELDQLTFCAIALAVTAIAMASVQTMEGMAMLRLEGLIDWKLQAAVIDRLLRLPASLFREYTVGDFVDRSLGIDAVRRVFTGRTLRSLMAGVFCWFSIFLMLYYDPKLALIAIALTLVRALLIIATSAVRLYHENRHFNLQGKVGGFVLQLLAGIGKLRVADATVRALAVWSKQFAAQKRALHRLPACCQCAQRRRDVVSDARHAHHLRRGIGVRQHVDARSRGLSGLLRRVRPVHGGDRQRGRRA